MTLARMAASLVLLVLACTLGVVADAPSAFAIDEPDRLWTVGEHAFADGLHPLARRVLERFIERNPGDRRVPEATLMLGRARLSLKAYQPALEAFRQAESFTPSPGKPGEPRF